MHNRRAARFVLHTLLLYLVLPSPFGHAGFLDWTGAVDNQFFRVPGNWSPNGNPGQLDLIAFSGAPTAASGLRIFDNTEVGTTYVVENATVNLRPEGRFFSGSPFTGGLFVGGGRFAGSGTGTTATLNLLDFAGNTLFETFSINVGSGNPLSTANGSTGRVEVNGGTTLRSMTNTLVGGEGNRGFVTVRDGGVFESDRFFVGNVGEGTNTFGYVTVAGTGSRMQATGDSDSHIGNQGTGTVEAINGGSVILSVTSVGQRAESNGHLAASGAGSTVETLQLTVGGEGAGTLSASGGGTITTTDVVAGANSMIRIRDANSQLSVSQLSQTGGALELLNGGRLQQVEIKPNHIGGYALLSAGSLNLASSLTLAGHLELQSGEVTAPSMHLAGNLTIHGGEAVFEQFTPTSNATINWTGGNLSVVAPGAPLVVGSTGLFGDQVAIPTGGSLTFGDLLIVDGMLEVNGSLSTLGLRSFGDLVLHDATIAGPVHLLGGSTIAVSGTSRFVDEVVGRADISGPGTVSFANHYRPGDPFDPAGIEFGGHVGFESTSTLELDLFGNLAHQVDWLDVSGTLTLGGTVDVQLAGGFTPSLGDAFDLLDFSSLVDDGFDLNLPELTGNLSWNVDSFAIDGTVSVVEATPPLDGDANADGVVDGIDFIIWNDNKFTTVTGGVSDADFNVDGIVDGLDFVIWNDNKFSTSDSLSAVPEPSLGSLVGMLILLIAMRPRR